MPLCHGARRARLKNRSRCACEMEAAARSETCGGVCVRNNFFQRSISPGFIYSGESADGRVGRKTSDFAGGAEDRDRLRTGAGEGESVRRLDIKHQLMQYQVYEKFRKNLHVSRRLE